VETSGSRTLRPKVAFRGVSRLRLLAVGGLAWAGMVAGHLLAYAIVYPRPHHRMEHLVATGHGTLPLHAICALSCAPAVLAVVALLRLRGRTTPRPTARWLAAIQILGFVLVESIERGSSAGSILGEPAFLLGLVLQVVIALVAAGLVRVVTRAVSMLVARPEPNGKAPQRISSPARGTARANRFTFLVCSPRRAPPVAVAA
jgi:hypothetical protein